jgi:hypothetical protein
MFESIKTALVKNNTQQSRNKDILKCEVGNTYTVRLIPNTANPEKTFFHYYTFGWTSFCTGQYVGAVSPSSFGGRDPIAEYRYKILKTGTEDEKQKARAIIRSEKWLVNAYVINDPVTPENNGKTMIVRYGKQLHKIIMDAIEGEGAEDLRLGLYLPEQGLVVEDLTVLIQLEAEKSLSQVLKPGLNTVVVQRTKPTARSTLVINLECAPLVQPVNPSDQRRLMAVLAELG